MSLIIQAAQLANAAHAGQLRKHTNRPFITHPARVAGRVCVLADATEELVAAAWLHDVIEDCRDSFARCDSFVVSLMAFPPTVIDLVQQLTNESHGPRLPRAQRKARDRERLRAVSRPAKIIKLLDRIDNLQELPPTRFRMMYIDESRLLVGALFDPTDALISQLVAEAIEICDVTT